MSNRTPRHTAPMLSTFEVSSRCEKHAGDVYPSRCDDCEPTAPTIFAPVNAWGECITHPNYPQPCDACRRDAAPTIP